MPAVALRTGDRDAVAIGKLCDKARGTMTESVKYLIEAGQKLIDKKGSLNHGEWMPWLKENAGALGFNGKNTAAKLMNAATIKFPSSGDFSEAEALQISKKIWGHNKPASKTAKSSEPQMSRKREAKQEKIARDYVRPLVAARLSMDYVEIGVKIKCSHVTVEKAAAIEIAIRDEPRVVDIDTLPKSAKEKLGAAIRQEKRKQEAEHATRMHGANEEIRLRVVDESKEYLAMVKEREAKVQKEEKWWQDITNNHKPLFTADQFKTILMCLHPDGQRTADKLADAFRLFNNKKLQLTGAKA
jgi:hypothetical protein